MNELKARHAPLVIASRTCGSKSSVCTSFYSAVVPERPDMEDQKEAQDARVKFYNSQTVVGYIRTNGVPKSRHSFHDMVESGTSGKLDGKKGLELIDVLGDVVFSTHPQQINVMDKSNGKTIASIRR